MSMGSFDRSFSLVQLLCAVELHILTAEMTEKCYKFKRQKFIDILIASHSFARMHDACVCGAFVIPACVILVAVAIEMPSYQMMTQNKTPHWSDNATVNCYFVVLFNFSVNVNHRHCRPFENAQISSPSVSSIAFAIDKKTTAPSQCKIFT